MGVDGSDLGRRRIRQLAENAKFFRTELKKMGFIVYGPCPHKLMALEVHAPRQHN